MTGGCFSVDMQMLETRYSIETKVEDCRLESVDAFKEVLDGEVIRKLPLSKAVIS